MNDKKCDRSKIGIALENDLKEMSVSEQDNEISFKMFSSFLHDSISQKTGIFHRKARDPVVAKKIALNSCENNPNKFGVQFTCN